MSIVAKRSSISATVVSDIAIFVLKRDVKLQLTNSQPPVCYGFERRLVNRQLFSVRCAFHVSYTRTVAMDITYTQSYICTCVWYSGVNCGCTYVLTRFGCFLWSRNRDTVVPGDILVIRNQKMLT